MRLRQIGLDLKLIFEKGETFGGEMNKGKKWWGKNGGEKMVWKKWWGKIGGEKNEGKNLVVKRFSGEKF